MATPQIPQVPPPRHLASSATDNDEDDPTLEKYDISALFRSAKWSPDGTCIVTHNSDNTLRTYVILARPSDFLTTPGPHTFNPFSVFRSPESISTFALNPYYNLADTQTTLAICAVSQLPIQLINTRSPLHHANYPLIHPQTERHITPHSLLFSRDGSRFIAGSDSLLSVFDVTRTSQGPLRKYPTIPSKRKNIVDGGVGMKGIVSALGIAPDGMLAAGTLTRWLGFYENEGQGDAWGQLSVAGADGGSIEEGGIGGSGITQCIWSPCGNYLYVVERCSDGILLYDMRSWKLLGRLRGRKALTNQKMGVEMRPVDDGYGRQGHELWGGGVDGAVRVWRNPYLIGGEVEAGGEIHPVDEWKLDNDAVSSAVFNPSNGVLATCAGSRREPADGLDLEGESGVAAAVMPSMKLWLY